MIEPSNGTIYDPKRELNMNSYSSPVKSGPDPSSSSSMLTVGASETDRSVPMYCGLPLMPLLLSHESIQLPPTTPNLDEECKIKRRCINVICLYAPKSDEALDLATFNLGYTQKTQSLVYQFASTAWTPGIESGLALWQRTISHQECPFISHPSEAVNKVLGGGLSYGRFTELCQSDSALRSKMCLQFCASLLHTSPSDTCLYIDSRNCFSSRALVDELLSLMRPSQISVDPHQIMNALNRIRCQRVSNLSELLKVCHRLQSAMRKHSEEEDSDFYSHLRLVVIDSVDAVVMPLIDIPNERDALLNHLANCLYAIVRQIKGTGSNCALLTTNRGQRVWKPNWRPGDEEEDNRQSALGPFWQRAPHIRLLVDTHGNFSVILRD